MAAEEAKGVDVTVRIDKADLGRFDEIVQALQNEGLADLQPHKRFGIVNGRVGPERMDALSRVRGVASVRRDQAYKAQ